MIIMSQHEERSVKTEDVIGYEIWAEDGHEDQFFSYALYAVFPIIINPNSQYPSLHKVEIMSDQDESLVKALHGNLLTIEAHYGEGADGETIFNVDAELDAIKASRRGAKADHG